MKYGTICKLIKLYTVFYSDTIEFLEVGCGVLPETATCSVITVIRVCVARCNSVLVLIGIASLLEAQNCTEIFRTVDGQNLCYCIILLYYC
jgi:hypothetical protein